MTITQTGSSAHTTSPAYRLNARTWAKKFKARLLEPGLVSYEDSDCGVALLRKETIDRCINTFIGRPVVIRHRKTTPENMKSIGHGYITQVAYNDQDGWWYGEGIVDTDEAAQEIRRAGFGSVAYTVTGKPSPGGDHHAIKYDYEITDFSGEHLAIVDNPRYEGATIKLNSKKQKSMFKLIKKLASRANGANEPAKPAVENQDGQQAGTTHENSAPAELSPETRIEIDADNTVSIQELVEAYNARHGETELSPEDEINVGDKPVKVSELISAYNEKNAPKNQEKPEAKPNKGAALYRLANAAKMAPSEPEGAPITSTMTAKLARGAERYGKK